MPIPRDNREQLPWPTEHRCSDGVVRNLAEYVAEEWTGCEDYPELDRICWRGERSSIAHSLGRRSLPEIRAMTPEAVAR